MLQNRVPSQKLPPEFCTSFLTAKVCRKIIGGWSILHHLNRLVASTHDNIKKWEPVSGHMRCTTTTTISKKWKTDGHEHESEQRSLGMNSVCESSDLSKEVSTLADMLISLLFSSAGECDPAMKPQVHSFNHLDKHCLQRISRTCQTHDATLVTPILPPHRACPSTWHYILWQQSSLITMTTKLGILFVVVRISPCHFAFMAFVSLIWRAKVCTACALQVGRHLPNGTKIELCLMLTARSAVGCSKEV